MDWLKLASALALLIVVAGVVGSMSRLAIAVSELRVLASVLLIVVLVVLVAAYAFKGRWWVANPYW